MDHTKYNQEISERLREWISMNKTQIIWAVSILLLGHVLLYGFYALVGGRDYANRNLLEILPELLFVDFLGAIGYFIYLAFYKIPAEIYIQQESDKQNLLEQIRFYDAKLIDVDFSFSEWEFSEEGSRIPVAVYDGYTTQSSINKTVGIRVQIPKGNDLWCYGALTSLVRINRDGSQDDLFDEATRNGQLISWNGGGVNSEGEVLVKDGKDRILRIAEGINRELIFKLLNLDFSQVNNGIYVFEIEVGGHILGKKIKSKKEYFHIIFEKRDKTFAGGVEKPYGSTDFVNETSVTYGYHEYTSGSYRKLDIRRGLPTSRF